MAWTPPPNVAAAALLALGLAQMSADLLGLDLLKGLAAATAASPAPKVFSSVRGLETYSVRFYLEWTDPQGRPQERELDSALYAKLEGPYNRRNVYGAVLAFGPVLASDPRTEKLHETILAKAACGEAPLLRELGLDVGPGPRRVRVVPQEGAPPLGALPSVLEARCP